MASFIRKVPTASGARAVQIVHKRGRRVVGIEHIGSAHDDAALAMLMEIARQRIKSEKMGASYATCPVCEGYGLIKNIEPAGLAALRKLSAAA